MLTKQKPLYLELYTGNYCDVREFWKHSRHASMVHQDVGRVSGPSVGYMGISSGHTKQGVATWWEDK